MMKKIFTISLLGFWLLISFYAGAQKTIVVIGSSTAFGTGATPIDSSWVNRLQFEFRKNMTDGVDTNIVNLAVGNTNTYMAMPTGYVPPPGRSLPDPNMNITKALSYNPHVIIVNFPSNDISVGHTKLEIMDNFRLIYQTGVAGGARVFIATTQPRDFSPNTTMMQYQRDLVDSIQNTFGIYAIDFWNDLVSIVPPNNIRPEVSFGDGIHVNNLGHRLLFQRVLAANLFPAGGPLPLKLLSFQAVSSRQTNILKWATTEEEPNTKFEIERSVNGRDFTASGSVDAKNGNSGIAYYSWTDQHPFEGKTFYRLKITEPSKTSYSKVVIADNRNNSLEISAVYSDGDRLEIKISSNTPGLAQVSLVGLSGSIVKSQKMAVTNSSQLTIAINDIAPGEYIIRLADNKGNVATQRFIKLK
jgi:lysophospholipase L1-like esterase